LHEAVSTDWPASLSDDEPLAKLLQLNLSRATGQAPVATGKDSDAETDDDAE
jgi:hypothetical protein